MEAADNLAIPAYYVLSRTATDEQIAKALSALSITPIQGVIATAIDDDMIALQFSPCVLFAASEETAAQVALVLSSQKDIELSPFLIISQGDFFLDAVYHDGRREYVNA